MPTCACASERGRAALRAVALSVLLLSACDTALDDALRLAGDKGWQAETIASGPFALRAFIKPGPPGAPDGAGGGSRTAFPEAVLSVYIEGDGRAWVSRTRPGSDPTPRDPVGLRLALVDPGPRVAYVARPCQYLADASGCDPYYWTRGRFADEVVAAVDSVISRLVVRSGAGRVRLIGYSGGGVLAALVAARRGDVAALITVAAPLDVDGWTRHHDVTPLAGLKPTDRTEALARIPQLHLVGGRDDVVPEAIVRSFVTALGQSSTARLVPVAGADHGCCWVEAWPAWVGAGSE